MVMRNGSALSGDNEMMEVNGGGGEEPSTSYPIRVDELDHWDEDWIMPFPSKDGVCIRKGEKFSDYYILHEEVGEGKFGQVYRCIEKATGLVLAAKCIKIRKDTDFEKVEKEVNIMTQMRHKCIAQIYDAFATDSNDVILIMEMVQGGELFDRIADDSYILTEMAVALIMYQIIEAIRYIHSQNIIHLDLKPENIMCVSQTSNKVKLIDFGLAQWYDGSKDLLFMAGTPEFAAPEVIKYEPLDFHTDMWSLGVIAYILLSGQSPFLGETLAHTYCNVEQARWMFCEEFTENAISMEAKDFISRLLILQKEKRMLPDECLRHPWIVKNKERALENASRAVSPAVCHPLAVEKLRSYVKNKKFRRLVFGVLFVNSVMRMLQTLQRNKSDHGIEYVRNMLEAAEEGRREGKEEESNMLLKAFTKKKIKKKREEKVVEEEKKEEMAKEEEEEKKQEEEVKEEEEEIAAKEEMEEERMETDEQKKDEEEEQDVANGSSEETNAKKTTKKRVVIVKRVKVTGEKKKRSKSEARRAAEQQRTRSSTEQTTSKKQRQEEEEAEEMEEEKRREAQQEEEEEAERKRKEAEEEEKVKKEQEEKEREERKLRREERRKKREEEEEERMKRKEEDEKIKRENEERKREERRKKREEWKRREAEEEERKKQEERDAEERKRKKEREEKKREDDAEKKKKELEGAKERLRKTKKSDEKEEEEKKKEEEEKKRKEEKAKQWEQERERLRQIKLEMDEKKKMEEKKSAPKSGQVMKMAQRMMEQQREEQQQQQKKQPPQRRTHQQEEEEEEGKMDHAPIMPSTSSAAAGLVSNMLKRLEQQRQANGGADGMPNLPLAFAITAVPARRKEKADEEEEGSKRKEEEREEDGKETFNWREDIRRKVEAEKRGEERKKQLKKKKKVVRRVKTEEEMKEADKWNGQTHEIDESKIGIIVERTKERIKREKMAADEAEAEAEEANGKMDNKKEKVILRRVKRREDEQVEEEEKIHKNGIKMEVNGFGGKSHPQQRQIPRLKVCGNSLGNKEKRRAATLGDDEEEDDSSGWSMVGQDVFDFSLLRMKLQNRIMGLKDRDELRTDAENKQKFELQKQQRELQTNLNIKRAMRKWVTLDKEARRQQQQQKKTSIVQIPEWAQ